MKSIIKLTIGIYTIFVCFSFTLPNNNGLNVTYGVSNDDPSQIELALNSNYTFTYQDLSIKTKKIMVEGTYHLKKDKIILNSDNEQINYHNKWKISDNGLSIKSRKGLTFYTLQKK